MSDSFVFLSEQNGSQRVRVCTMLAIPPYADLVHRHECLDQAARYRRMAHALADREEAEKLLAAATEHERSAWKQ